MSAGVAPSFRHSPPVIMQNTPSRHRQVFRQRPLNWRKPTRPSSWLPHPALPHSQSTHNRRGRGEREHVFRMKGREEGFPPAQTVKNLPAMVQTLGQEDPLEKEMATHSSIFAWRIPCTEEPGGLQSMGSQRVRHN